ncbi:MAG: hypothetical protein AAGI66_03305 [Cyanobacteria bacterium P01_H01_bin.74]
MGQAFTKIQDPATIRNSVLRELTRDFEALLKAAKKTLSLEHPFTISCRHAVAFPTDKMSVSMLWEEFQAMPVAERAEILRLIRQ